MRVVSRAKLIEQLKSTDGASSFVSIRTAVEPRMRKTDNPYWGKLLKYSTINGLINVNYSSSVSNQREREGIEEEFVAEQRKWGVKIPKTPLVEHRGEFYLEIKVHSVSSSEYITLDGEVVDRELVKPFLYIPKQAATQKTEKPIILRDFKISSIRSITMHGEEFAVVTSLEKSLVKNLVKQRA